MTDSFVTQCPHCQTSFRVSHAQLSVARGVVRCGACLQVFNAARQLLEQRASDEPGKPVQTDAPLIVEPPIADPLQPTLPVAQVPTAEPAAPARVEPARVQDEDEDLWQVSEMDLDNLNLDEELARLEKRDNPRSDSFARHNRNDDSMLTAQRDNPKADQSAWVDTLHNDDVSHLPELQAEIVDEPAHHDDDEHGHPADNDRTEPSLSAGNHLDDDEPMVPPVSLRKQPVTEKAERWSAVDDDDIDDHDDEYVNDEPEPDPRSKRTRNEPAVRDKPLIDLTDDPLQLDWQPPKPRSGRRLAWALLILLALVGLAGQYIWYHFDQLARQDQYRPWFQQLCPQIGCKVPSKVDISLLKSSNLVVRSHPEFQGALIVDAIIYNRASFSQPFPLLELRFADTSGQLIASRRFKPGEYLSGEMAGKEEMPPQTPIHIALDILDPGAKAVNYSLNFRSPE
ncbi:Uncharacterized protein ALO52_04439 [Pseudomonas syringae pv. primulae]|uniref:Zinc finger/thioredoxin putative domain-containing protein n=1 Tax=Pseudomonas syringae pv. primulae TaxID=251707 RepID=A0A0P9XPA9_9PSED|nr:MULTISPECIES: DUF3426 domain-containing protein [Pseudomonas syringae group]KPY37573.1 Uncharacterized protein ALO52_04439 [Pseudomonas syringae pv. primulae]MBD8187963.1 DUF3426 domain-containing protein [Pseudomonas viridiflava]